MQFRHLLLTLLFVSLNSWGVDIPQGVVPLFSALAPNLSEDSVHLEYPVAKSSFEESIEIGNTNKFNEVSPLLVLGEELGFNALIWAWDRYVLDKDYARTGPSYWKRNFQEGWEWDHNHWAINFYGHPYQGSVYYNIARGSGYGFYSSLLFAAFGSYTCRLLRPGLFSKFALS